VAQGGLAQREAERRLLATGPNVIRRRAGSTWPRLLRDQLIHPLALLLWVAAALALATAQWAIAVAIVAVIVLNAAFAFLQERQAERSVEALAQFLPPTARVLRDGTPRAVDAAALVPGDLLLIGEGDRISADARMVWGEVEMDMSALTGESVPVPRTVGDADADTVFSGTLCTAGQARAVVVATGMSTEIGRIAALTERTGRDPSPLEQQVRRVAIVIALVAVGVGVLFLPLGMLAGLGATESVAFAIGLIVANVPEGLLPTITLALALGVRVLARSGALVKRLSAVETLGSTTVICTDKTGTLTRNRMRPARAWTGARWINLEGGGDATCPGLARALAACSVVHEGGADPTEIALLDAAGMLGAPRRAHGPRVVHRFDAVLRRMSVVTADAVVAKGAPESIIPLCTGLGDDQAREAQAAADAMAADGLRVLAVATRPLPPGWPRPGDRSEAEHQLELMGMVGLIDPPRESAAHAVARCRSAGVRVLVVTGDNGLTAAAIARRVGLPVDPVHGVVTGAEVDALPDDALDALLRDERVVIVARSAPATKLRIAESLQAEGHVVAMTGDGVNDAPALRRADIGIAMGASGTDVAREAATMVLATDDFGGIVAAVEAGRRVFANVRKFILYIFAHAPAEVIPFLLFALSGGAIPLPLTVLQILAIDLGTETLPALALGREPAEPGLMDRPPRRRDQGVIDGRLLARAWGVLGLTSAVLVTGAFITVLVAAGWSPGDATGPGTPLHDAWVSATATTFAAIVACQVGTAWAARTEHARLRDVGVWSNPLLLWGIAFELAFLALLLYVPPIAEVFGTAPLSWELLILLPFPVIVWAVDAIVRRTRPVDQATS
jgi:calcium-translocating P-type ATPase